jgi:hypothetical protein
LDRERNFPGKKKSKCKKPRKGVCLGMRNSVELSMEEERLEKPWELDHF